MYVYVCMYMFISSCISIFLPFVLFFPFFHPPSSFLYSPTSLLSFRLSSLFTFFSFLIFLILFPYYSLPFFFFTLLSLFRPLLLYFFYIFFTFFLSFFLLPHSFHFPSSIIRSFFSPLSQFPSFISFLFSCSVLFVHFLCLFLLPLSILLPVLHLSLLNFFPFISFSSSTSLLSFSLDSSIPFPSFSPISSVSSFPSFFSTHSVLPPSFISFICPHLPHWLLSSDLTGYIYIFFSFIRN